MTVADMADNCSYRMELQYDGSSFCGWAKQPGLPTIEHSLEDAFATVLGWAPILRVAGRTDAGVHARHQVVSLQLPHDLDPGRLVRALNALTPPSIAVSHLVLAPEGFDARKDAVSRVYRYHLCAAEVVSPFWRSYVWWLPTPLELPVMKEAASLVVGRHDFTAFTPTETSHVFFHRRVLRCQWWRRKDGILVFEIEAEAFLRNMVRVLVGTMVELGQGRRTVEEFRYLLEGGARADAGVTAPARGLFLWDVKYRDERIGTDVPSLLQLPL